MCQTEVGAAANISGPLGVMPVSCKRPQISAEILPLPSLLELPGGTISRERLPCRYLPRVAPGRRKLLLGTGGGRATTGRRWAYLPKAPHSWSVKPAFDFGVSLLITQGAHNEYFFSGAMLLAQHHITFLPSPVMPPTPGSLLTPFAGLPTVAGIGKQSCLRIRPGHLRSYGQLNAAPWAAAGAHAP